MVVACLSSQENANEVKSGLTSRLESVNMVNRNLIIVFVTRENDLKMSC